MDKNLETFLRLSDCYGVKMHRYRWWKDRTTKRRTSRRKFFIRMFYGICVPGFAKYGINCAEN